MQEDYGSHKEKGSETDSDYDLDINNFDCYTGGLGISNNNESKVQIFENCLNRKRHSESDLENIVNGLIEFGPPNKINLRLIKGLYLKDYQISAIEWMLNISKNPKSAIFGLKGGIISLEMGLGKGIIGLSYILSKDSFKQNDKEFESSTSLIVCRKTLISTWIEELHKFFGNNNFEYIVLSNNNLSSTSKYQINYQELKKQKIVFVSYSQLSVIAKNRNFFDITRKGKRQKPTNYMLKTTGLDTLPVQKSTGESLIFKFQWDSVLCDESHCFSNSKALIYNVLMLLNGKNKFCLTGTPIRNYMEDLYSQFRFLGLSCDNKSNFEKLYTNDGLNEFVYFKSYQDCNVNLPPINVIEERLEFTDEEKEFYKLYKYDLGDEFGNYIARNESFEILECILRLRQICLCSRLVLKEKNLFSEILSNQNLNKKITLNEKILDKFKENKTNNEWLENVESTAGINSTKIRKTIEILQNEIPFNEKVIIFSLSKKIIKLFKLALEKFIPNLKCLFYNGDCSTVEREKIIYEFKTNPESRAIFMTFQTGCEGLNIFEANNIILTEGWYNYALSKQAISRVYRIGQVKTVNVWRLMINNTIEQRMEELCKKKQLDFDAYVKYKNKHFDIIDMKFLLLEENY